MTQDPKMVWAAMYAASMGTSADHEGRMRQHLATCDTQYRGCDPRCPSRIADEAEERARPRFDFLPPLYAKPFFDPAMIENLRQKADRMLRALMRHRERYLSAWIAQTGILPTDAVLVEREVWDRENAAMAKVVEVVTKAEAARRFG